MPVNHFHDPPLPPVHVPHTAADGKLVAAADHCSTSHASSPTPTSSPAANAAMRSERRIKCRPTT
jgi:hypothetical protein